MSINTSRGSAGKKFIETLNEINQRVSDLVTNNARFFIVPKLSADPANPQNGQIWYNTATNKFRKRENGATSDL
jgi:hypothetical protein